MSHTTKARKHTLAKAYEFAHVEKRWLEKWQEEGTFDATMIKGRDSFSIVIPPPNVTGVLHVGHALNNTLQDILTRYHRMLGDNTLWVPGTDHAGIATQNVVERQLHSEGTNRHELGRERFIERVWEWKKEKGDTIIRQLKKLGCSCDWRHERFTMDEGLSRAVREVFVRLYDEGLIYRGDYIVNWCPRCLTALADDEVEHEPLTGKLYHIRYPYLKGNGYLVVATTRPETMLGDTGVAVHPDDERYNSLPEKAVRLPLTDRVIPIVFDHHVRRDFGTGALKVTPAHDRDDYEIGRRHNLEILKVMDGHGVMNEKAGKYAGLDRFACRRQVVADLEELGLLEGIEEYDHAVGKCYRCSTVVEPTTSLQWFVSVRPLAERAVAAVREGRIRIYPDTWYNTFYSWMENIRDWCISRQIWWGHRIPAWTCEDCRELVVATEDPENCPQCGGSKLQQETDVLDTWFSSALWPFSTLGWPDSTPELKFFYPTSILITSFDILFFWVARMMMMGLHFLDEVPFRDVYLHALVRDKHGKKMSKSTGNVIDPLEVMARYGTDALRFTLTAFAAQGREIRLDEDRIEGYRHFINKLWNAARFALMHLDEEDLGFVGRQERTNHALHHRWILSRAAQTIRQSREALDNYNFNEVAAAIYQFTWHEFCDWYLEWIKPDLYGDDPEAARQARGVMLHVLEIILGLLHPITPFVTEEIWSVLPGKRHPIMTTPFPEYEAGHADQEAEEIADFLMGIINGVRHVRSEAGLHPTVRVDAFVICPHAEKRQWITVHADSIKNLTRAANLTVVGEGEVPPDAGTYLYREIEIYIPLQDLVDVDAELAKNAREAGKLEKELARVTAKLANENFLKRAPKDVVRKERDKREELETRLAKLRESARRLDKLR